MVCLHGKAPVIIILEPPTPAEFYDKNVNIKLNRSKFNSELKPEIINFLEKQNINYIDLHKELSKRKIDINIRW